MNKNDIITAVSMKLGVTKKDTGIYLEAILKTLTDAMARGEKINLANFGAFETVERAARETRNPSTGEMMMIESHKAVKFRAGKALRDAVNE